MTPKQAYSQIDNYLKYMINIKLCSPHTVRAYKKDLEEFFDPVKTSKPHKNDLKSYFSAQLVGLGAHSLASRNRKVGTLKSFLNWLYDTRLIDVPMSEFYHSPKVPRKIPHFVSFDEISACLTFLNRPSSQTQIGDELIHRQQRLMFLLLYGAGLRISEACHLRVTDINTFGKKILIRGKGAKERFVVCPDFVWIEWDRYHNYLKSISKMTHVFFRLNNLIPEDDPINERTGYEWIRTIGRHAGLTKNLNPHALRHSFATHLLNSGANLRAIQNLLGHSSLTATEKYTHLNLSQLYQTLEKTHPLGKLKKSKV